MKKINSSNEFSENIDYSKFDLLRDSNVWKSASGISRPISKLSNNHLNNIIKNLSKENIKFREFLEFELTYRNNNEIIIPDYEVVHSDEDLSKFLSF